MMIYRAKASEYRLLARRYLEEGVPDRVLVCLAKALDLDPGCGREEIDRMLQEAAAQPLGPEPPPSSSEIARLDRRRRKLDRLLEEEEETSQSLRPPPPEPAAATAPPVSAELIGRLRRLALDLRTETASPRLLAVRRRLKAMVRRLSGGSAVPRTKTPRRDPSERWLSPEHRLHNLGNDFYKAEHSQAAVQCFTLALDVRPDLLESWFNRSLAYTRCGDYTEAERDLDKVIEMNPRLSEAFYTRGLVHQYQDDLASAAADFTRALDVDPDYQRAREQLETVQRKRAESSAGRRKTSGSAEEEGQIRDFSIYLVKPDCRLRDVGGHRDVKRRLAMIAAYLQGNPIFAEWGVEPPRGVLLCGRPGVGKTHLVRALAGEVNCPFYAPPISVFEDMYAGNTQKNLRGLWDEASRHPQAILFLDEFDSLAQNRAGHRRSGEYWYNRIVGCLLELMDNLAHRSNRLVVVAATNCRQDVDKAFLRPGRFSYVVNVATPSAAELAEIWLIHLEAAAHRADRLDSLAPHLAAAVYANRQNWLGQAFSARCPDDSGLVRLSRLAEEKGLVGDDVREIVRRTVEERAADALECGVDHGPIDADDLHRQLDAYEPACTAH
jgi:tetratricopeptide (TPR) repeat protein